MVSPALVAVPREQRPRRWLRRNPAELGRFLKVAPSALPRGSCPPWKCQFWPVLGLRSERADRKGNYKYVKFLFSFLFPYGDSNLRICTAQLLSEVFREHRDGVFSGHINSSSRIIWQRMACDATQKINVLKINAIWQSLQLSNIKK